MKKSIKSKAFEKKYVKLLQHQKDKNFFKSCYTEDEEGYFNLKKDLPKEEKKKLKLLFKDINANRKGAVKFFPLIIFGAIVAGIVFFFTTIANPLLGSLLEKGLEAIFEAKSDVRGFRLSLLKFEISMKSVTVANADKPMTNLFEMDRAIISLKPAAVLRGKIYIEEVSAAGICFGTPRTVSGALPGYVRRQDREKPVKEDAPPLIDLANFDAWALLNQEFDKLNTPKLYDTAINAYNETSEKWKNQVEEGKARVEELRNASAPFMNLNASSFSVRTPEDIQKIRDLINDINTLTNSTRGAINDVNNIVNGLEADINMVRELERTARNSITSDINHLKSYIDLGSGAAFAAVEPFIMDVLSDAAEEYLSYGIMALDALEKINALQAQIPKSEKPKKEPKVVFKGRDVIFPTVQYPQFYLGRLATDVKFPNSPWKGNFDLRDISSSPDLHPKKPVTLDLGMREEGGQLAREVVFAGMADFRSNPQERFNARVDANGFPISIKNQFDKLGISGFSGKSEFNVNVSGKTDKSFSIGADVNIVNASLDDARGTIAEAMDRAITRANRIDLGILYTHSPSERDNFRINTNIASLFMDALREIAQVYVTRAMAEIERVLLQKIDEYIDGRFDSKEALDALIATARGDRTAINQINSILENKKNEFEQQIRSAANQAVDQAREQATQQVQQQLQNVLPSLPRLPGR